jgi:membrane protease YdiL (CAAX protease family)
METTKTVPSNPTRWALPLALVVGYAYPVIYFVFVLFFLNNNPTGRYFASITFSVLLAVFAFWLCKKDGISMEELGLRWPKLLESLLLVAVSWAVIIPLSDVVKGQSWLEQAGDPIQIVQQWMFVAFMEELFFRGYLTRRFMRVFQTRSPKYATLLAVLVSCAIFATYHIPNKIAQGFDPVEMLTSLLMLFALGVVFSYFYLRSGTILLATLVHGSWNAPIIGAQSNELLILLVCALVLEGYLWVRRRRSPEEKQPFFRPL